MSKTARPSYLCSECGWGSSKWVGRCGECQAWGSVAEVGDVKALRSLLTALRNLDAVFDAYRVTPS